MNKIFNNEKGVNLITLSVAIIIIIAIAGIVLYNVRTNLGIQKLQTMQSDIENLKGKVSNYYLQYGAIPILEPEIDESVLLTNVKTVENNNVDKGNYYIIDLSALENLTLTYGKDYEIIKNEPDNISSLKENTLTDIYVINSVSHNIFYVAGINYEGKLYYKEYQDVEDNDIGISKFDFTDIETDNWSPIYSSTKKYKDKNEDTAIIPKGFQVSRKQGEDTIENGLVIRDSKENEWVWIPVSSTDLAKMYKEDTTGWKLSGSQNVYTKYATISTTIGNRTKTRGVPGEYRVNREPDLVDKDVNKENYKDILGFDSASKMAEELRDDYKDMIDSIKINGGFYIGRYELGKDENNSPQVKKGTVMNNTNWYYLYKACTSFSGENLKSRMIWGCQWDQICRFVNEHGDKVSLENSKDYGNYNDSTVSSEICGRTEFNNTTGRSDYWKANNIYDIAGNCSEITQQGYGSSGRSCSGGEYRRNGTYDITFDTSITPDTANNYTTSRPVLYVK